MTDAQRMLVVGGTSGIGREIATRYAGEGWAVTLSGRDAGRASEVAAEVGGGAVGIAVDLSRPDDLPAALADVGPVDHLVLAAIARDANTVQDYDVGVGDVPRDDEADRLHRRPCTRCWTASRRTGPSCSSAGWPRSGPTRARRPSRP